VSSRYRLLHPPLIALLVSLAISASIAMLAPLPAPQFHDEFSYLLAGDTFARGRVTNPPHPHWEFFETFQVLSQPTYASKYPPGQGAVLAVGIALSGEALVGVWISTALACAAVAWMLRAAVSRRWAMLGGIAAAIHPLVLDWNWSYWGGSLAMLGGALLVGAVLRMRRRASWVDGVVAGIGIAVLANSRPMEGAILTTLCGAWLLTPLAASQTRTRDVSDLRRRKRRLLAALAAVLAINFAWMGYYNWRVTGSVTTLPYWEYERQYAYTRPLAWMPLPATAPVYRHTPLREYYLDWEVPRYQRQRSIGGFVAASAGKLWDLAQHYGRAPTLALALIGLPWAWRRGRGLLFASIVLLICLLNTLPSLTLFPPYLAPAASVLALVLVACCFGMIRKRPIAGKALGALIVYGQMLAGVWWAVRRARNYDPNAWHVARQNIIHEMGRDGSKVLIFARADPGYYWHNEYVYNSPDIDSQAVVWARDMGDATNRKLIE
jgi:hypothetical protein